MIEVDALFFINCYYQFAILNVREYRGVIDNHFAVKLKDCDNPGRWSSFTFQSEYEKGRGTGDYKLHIFPTGASPVPLVDGKIKVVDWEFYYKVWFGMRIV